MRPLPVRSAVILAALLGAACSPIGSSGGASATQPLPPTSASPSTTVSATAAWPPGDPVPSSLAGTWYFPLHATEVTLSGNDYRVVQTSPANHAAGNVVVNGDEIDFFNGSGCGIPLPDGVGRYRWKLEDNGSVQFTALNPDPCGRVDILANATWTRTP